jgi:hypothetical protein
MNPHEKPPKTIENIVRFRMNVYNLDGNFISPSIFGFITSMMVASVACLLCELVAGPASEYLILKASHV